MNVGRIIGLILLSALSVPAEDFSLDFNGATPITLHTTLTREAKGVRLVATAKNQSGMPAKIVRICVLSPSVKSGCLFEMWNTETLANGKELSWDVTTDKKVSTLTHDATLEAFEVDGAPAVQPAPPVPSQTVIQTRPPDSAASEVLTNDTIVKLAKAGLGDDVIVGMISRQPGNYSHGSDEIIRMKEAGVSDKVIAAILESKPQLTDAGISKQVRVEINSRLYIGQMEENLDNFIAAEVIKQKLPMHLVLDERDADYILTGLSQKTEVKWYDVVSGSIVGGKDRMEASAKMVRVKDRTFVWAGESGDRSLIFGALKRGGQRKLAERIVSKMKQDLF